MNTQGRMTRSSLGALFVIARIYKCALAQTCCMKRAICVLLERML
jgi:hypothetical protein